ncbi:MAG: hypothetical protein KTR16_00630 [Acidiferrobacterales bacterium]|nr:hypothetical protein [Acidiferrobacterales bacterium]
MTILKNRFYHFIKSLSLIISLLFFAVACAQKPIPNQAQEQSTLFNVKHHQVQIKVGEQDAGQRLVDVSVSYPEGAGEFPLIVFSHGHALDNQSYYNLTDYWVARGYVVTAPMHLDSGGDLEAASLVTEKYGSDWISVARLLEMQTIIDQIDSIADTLPNFSGQILIDRIIAAGHSYGALSSQQLSGAKVELQGNSIYPIPSKLISESVVAVVAISPPGLMPGHLSEATWQEYSTPQLVVTGPNDFFPHIWPSYEDHFISYLTAQEGNNYLLVLDEMDHYLGNLIGRLERDGPPQTLALQNLSEISLTFIESYLTQDDEANTQLNNFDKISQRKGVLRYQSR